MKNTTMSENGSALVTVVVLCVVMMIMSFSLVYSSRNSVKKSGVRRTSVNALNIAEAGKEHLYSLLRIDSLTLTPNTMTNVFYQHNIGSTADLGHYTVTCSTNLDVDTFWIRSTGFYQNSTKTLRLRAVFLPEVDPTKGIVDGAVTARSVVDIKGNIFIDGNDYDATALTVVDPGVYGISTCQTVTNFDKASSEVGGNGVMPVAGKTVTNPAIVNQIIKEFGDYASRLVSPEVYFGVSSGALDKYKVATLEDDFEGVFYVEGDADLPKSDCAGIVIVHNKLGNAVLKINGGSNFKGLIVADKIDKINGTADVLGAVVLISPMSVIMEGLGDAKIKYSSETLASVHKICSNMIYYLVEEEWLEE